MILTFLITIIVEGTVVLGYSFWRKKPSRQILFTSILANLITQSFLWVVLYLFFQHYLISLLLAEILIWIMESTALHHVPANKLLLQEATFLSLLMNLASFGIGWFLPT